jgi:hypothetical protein
LHIFCNDFFKCFHIFFCEYFKSMFQVFHFSSDACCKRFHLDVSKVDRVLLLGTHLPQPPAVGRRRAGTDVQAGDAEGARAVPA